MDWGIKLRRTQSLKNLPSSCDKPARTDFSLTDKVTSVSQLVARYQTTVKASTLIQTTSVNHGQESPAKVLQEKAPSLVERKETDLVSLLKRNEEREQSRAKAGLSKAKSMDSLQSGTGSIAALKNMFESKDTTQTKEKISIRAANSSTPHSAHKPVVNGEVEVKNAAEEQKNHVAAKKDHVTKKAVNLDREERRRTIAGIDFENLAACQTDEKRRSIADFRDGSFIQTKEKLSVSVKAMSALYLSKVAPQESANNPVKLGQDQSHETGKRGKPVKMSEESTSQQRQDGLHPSPSGAEDISLPHSQLSREKFYQQRQKCELRRLLKHTHPELKMLDDVVDEELAEVWSSEKETAGETGYEGEVFSRCLIFENSGLSNTVSSYNTPTMNTAEGGVERCDVRKMSAAFEEPKGKTQTESVEGIIKDDKSPGFRPDLNTECEEEMIRIDIQATKKLFESQPVNTFRPNSHIQGEISVSVDKTKAVQKQKMCRKEKNIITDQEKQPHKQLSCVHTVGKNTEQNFWTDEDLSDEAFTSFPESEGVDEMIKTSAALFKNNPFISANIERENSFAQTSKTQIPTRDSEAGEDHLTANVKNRTHLFESMPFDKIRHQNKDDIQTMVENIEETLNFLYKVNAIHSHGSIIEVNETMIAKKVKFTLSERGPEINYDEVTEGGAQNFVLQMLPRVNLKPQITYLKEDSKGCMKATTVNVPIQQRQFSTSKDTECKTANVAQVVEDILNQDNSLRKGMIIQEDGKNSVEVIVYALYNYFDEEDVKSYSPPQGAEYNELETGRGDTGKPFIKETKRGMIESAKNSRLETSQVQTCQESVQAKGNVKLFTSCIEKGDLDYLKTLQAEPTVQEEPQNQSVVGQGTELHYEHRDDLPEENSSEWVPVDVKRLKSIFSGDQSQIQAKDNMRIYSPQQGAEYDETQLQSGETSIMYSKETRQNIIESAKNSLLETTQDQTCSGSIRPEVTAKGNVHLFKSCIERGDLDYLKTLQAEPTDEEEDRPQNQTEDGRGRDLPNEERGDLAEESSSEWIPVDIKRLKSIFSGNQNQNLEILHHEHKQITSQERPGKAQEKAASQASHWRYDAHDDDKIHQAELVQVIDEKDEISNLHTAIHDLQQATIEAKALYDSSKVKQKMLSQKTSEKPLVPVTACEDKKSNSCTEPRAELPSASSGHTLDCQHNNIVTCHKAETTDMSRKKDQKGTEVVQKQLFETDSTQASEITPPVQQEDKEVVFEGKIQAALESLERSNINITKGDFKAAMIYRNSSKPHQEKSQNVDVMSNQKLNNKEFSAMTETESAQKPQSQKVTATYAEPPQPTKTQNKPDLHTVSEKNKKTIGPKPVLPPKPEHLTVKQRKDQSNYPTKTNMEPKEIISPGLQTLTSVSYKDALQQDCCQSNSDSVDQINELSVKVLQRTQGTEVSHQVQGLAVTLESNNIDANIVNGQQQINVKVDEKRQNVVPVKGNMNESEESRVEFHEACQTFGGKKALPKKTAPAKPKRVKIAQPVQILTDPLRDASGQTDGSMEKNEKETKQESRVEMREKKGRTETEDERRQRLSVHMDEIMRGNITAALEIFDKLRKQEELQSILCRVEEIEQDTSDVDVRSLRRVFENVPDWVVSSVRKEENKVKEENKDNIPPVLRDNSQTKTSMAHIFGDLERASEEIMNLKEQTLARLVDIEEAIKKALYSVSTLKSDSDIAGLSCLFKESLGAVQGSSGNISKISIESSRTKSHQAKGNVETTAGQGTGTEPTSAKQRASPPSSPAFISIQSAARKTDTTDVAPPETLICQTCQQSPKFRTTKTLTCNSPAEKRRGGHRKRGQKQVSHSQRSPNRGVSVLEVQTDHEGKSIVGTTTVTENYERTDNSGNRFYSSKTSTVVTTQPETTTSSTSQVVISPATYQVTTYPDVQLPVNKMPK